MMMKQEDELALKVTKEIVVKFIETGRLSVASFDEVFKKIHGTVTDALQRHPLDEKDPG